MPALLYNFTWNSTHSRHWQFCFGETNILFHALNKKWMCRNMRADIQPNRKVSMLCALFKITVWHVSHCNWVLNKAFESSRKCSFSNMKWTLRAHYFHCRKKKSHLNGCVTFCCRWKHLHINRAKLFNLFYCELLSICCRWMCEHFLLISRCVVRVAHVCVCVCVPLKSFKCKWMFTKHLTCL